jgi:predicted transposase/invertase (TIGR01784 family)
MNNDFIMLPTVDYCFKELMQNAKVRKGFVAALLHVPPESIQETTLLPTILSGATPDEKTGILDVRVRINNGAQLDLEMQVLPFKPWDKRVLFYLSRMYSEQLQKGSDYGLLKKCIHVSILNFVYFPNDEMCYRKIHFREDQSGRLYTDAMEIQVLELPKLKGEFPDNDDVYCWMKFFGGKNREEFEQMAKTNEYLNEAYQELAHLSADEIKRLEYEAREKAIRDHHAFLEAAKSEGLEKGFQQGREQGLQQGLEQGLQQGLEQGLQRGSSLKLISMIRKKQIKGCSVAEIAEALEEKESLIQQIVDNLKAHPDWNDQQLLTLPPFQLSETGGQN